MRVIVFLIIVFLLVMSTVYSTGVLREEERLDENPEKQILLKSRHFVPERGINRTEAEIIRARFPSSVHVLIQFDNIPSEEEKEQLENNGIKLLSYIPNKAWLASIISEEPELLEEISNVRTITGILQEDKISSAIKNKNYVKNGGKMNLSVMFFSDVNLDDASLGMENYGEVVDKFYSVNAIKIITEERFISGIAREENVQWIDVADRKLEMHNNGNRENVGVNILQASPYSLSGVNVVTSEWDGGWADTTHDDLDGRVTIGDAGCGEANCQTGSHATHVAGTMLGNGTLSESAGGTALQWRGMAPNATVISYEWWDDSTELNNEYNAAINTYNASLSQNSWGYTYFGCGADCSGGYDSSALELDKVIRGSKGKRISQVWSAGNNRPSGCDSGSYDCISIPATAKNIITVGATNSNDDSMTSFSSWGPTNDGRLKPEVTAPGCQVGGDGGVKSTVPTDTYNIFCGTSMAAPTTSGVVALMYEEFANKGVYPWPSTIKAILIHTAKDLGNTGPDYSFGYGRINATEAIGVIKNDTESDNIIIEESIANGNIKEFNMTVSSSVKVTLVWDDFPATANANPTLVNDLNLILIAPNGTLYQPWILDPANPGNAATKGKNIRDNVEQVVVENGISGIWGVRVNASSVPNGPQNFSLLSDHSFTIQPTVLVKTFRNSLYSQKDKFFDNGQTIFIQANVTAGGDPLEGNSVAADLILNNGTLEASLTLNEFSNGIYRNSWNSTSHTNNVYTVNVSVSGNFSGNGKNKFHLYLGAGVSAYLLDLNEDGKDDKVLENKHIVSVFKRELNKSPILYYEQKDTNVSYNFLESPYKNATSRGGISSDDFEVKLNFSFGLSGENLQNASMNMELLKFNPRIVDPALNSSNQACGINCNGCTNNDACASPICKGTGGTKAYIDDIRVNATVVEPNSNITVTIDTVQSFTSDCSAIYYKPPGGSFQQVFCRCPPQFVSETHSVTFNIGSVIGVGIIRTTMNDGGSSCAVCATSGGENDRMNVTIASVTEESFDFLADVNISLNSEDVDYLVYNLRNFNESIFPDSIFSDIYGTLDSVDDDRYHVQSGTDNLIISLPGNQWNNFNSNYSLVYDNLTSDNVSVNVIAFVRFNETIKFQDIGLWNGSEGLRIRYNTTSILSSDEINYILAFTKGDFQTIDQWMSTIQSGQFPSPNFLTSPLTEFISITLFGYPIDFTSQNPNTQDNPGLGNPYTIRVDPETTVNVDIYQKGNDFSGGSVLGINNMSWFNANNSASSYQMLKNYQNNVSNIAPGTNVSLYYWLDIPMGQAGGDYNTTINIKAVEIGGLL